MNHQFIPIKYYDKRWDFCLHQIVLVPVHAQRENRETYYIDGEVKQQEAFSNWDHQINVVYTETRTVVEK